MKTIKIFLASSNELVQDRKAFREFISLENDRLHKHDIYLELEQWEYSFSAVTNEGTQTAYNQLVKESDIVVCLFYKKAGPYTQKEFDAALEEFLLTGKPLIYVWLRANADGTTPVQGEIRSLRSFRKRLDELKHFYNRYKNNDDLHNQFRRQMDMMAERGILVFREDKRKEAAEEIENYKRRLGRRQFIKLLSYAAVVFITVIAVLWWYRHLRQFEPFNLKVNIENKTPNTELPGPVGMLWLTYGTKTEPSRDSVKTEAQFESVPGNYRNDTLRLRYVAEGFLPVDTGIVYDGKLIVLPVYRNQDLAELKGFISNDAGQPLEGVRVFTDCCSTATDASGRFILQFPFQHQRVEQRVQMYKKGYQPKDFTTPVRPGEMPRLVLYR